MYIIFSINAVCFTFETEREQDKIPERNCMLIDKVSRFALFEFRDATITRTTSTIAFAKLRLRPTEREA